MVHSGARFSQLLFLSLALVTSLCFRRVHSGMMFSQGPCPEGVAKGGSWNPKDLGACTECTCFSGPQQGYECRSCGVYGIPLDSPECYLTKDAPDSLYPDCCNVVQRCPGDADYDASQVSGASIIG